MIRERSIESTSNPEKAARWEALRTQVEQLRDKMGKGVDGGIKETVIAFLANKFPARASCEGHLEERFGEMRKISPYVQVGIEPPEKRFVDEAETEETPEYKAMRAKNLELKKSMEELITEFYRDRSLEKSPALRISAIGGKSGRFAVDGLHDDADGVAEADMERYRAELASEQADMAAFTEFLKERFLNEQEEK